MRALLVHQLCLYHLGQTIILVQYFFMVGSFPQVITREFEPCKPHPASVFEICKSWDLKPEEVVVVGDDKTDMTCGLRAGVGGK